MTLIVDAGGLLSVFDGDQPDHALFLEAVQTARDPLIVSPLVLAQLDHFILDRLGRKAQLVALEEIEAAYKVDQFTNKDLARARALCARYADLTTFDLTDASCWPSDTGASTSSPPISATSAPSPAATGGTFVFYPMIGSETKPRRVPRA